MGNKRKYQQRAGDEGYTLLELLVVLAILALLATFAAPAVLKYLGSAKEDVAGVQLENLAAALNLYRLEVGDYPSTDDGLQALLTAPKDAASWNGPYLEKESGIIDPWGTPYVYKKPGTDRAYDLMSYGADKVAGGENENADIVARK
ncbi:type II secretion system major pseudopilin GspG [Emcibacter nanhaiensis]|uniref:Type II secretion system core protein G n=1 Tax=Emcibacter nanhaiensis TaxID=1505037 RepID=A0A501PJ49_9PROT|nr:type II secretion system major pseudopilin GspG [Emcibacter nanhaiensis]TPD60157.1 type II secretion system protein GspG [Emcibacter nanhaiensis]